ncbi:MAG: alpha/beta hydrolase-fold protein [Kofleriaceae bacterium]
MRTLVPALFVIAACTSNSSPSAPGGDDDTEPPTGSDTGSDNPPPSSDDIFDLYDQAQSCDTATLTKLSAALGTYAGPVWSNGRALFRTQMPAQIAGDWNNWSTSDLASTALCNTDLVLAAGPVPTGFHQYKIFHDNTWSLDAMNPAFEYDDFAGNPDGRNNVLNTPDSGRGNIVELPQECSTALGNCRDVTAYLPAGYYAPANASKTYPVMFMFDGQNIWDDHDCCFGHTGWEINITLDSEIAAGKVAPIIVIGAASTSNRNNEYGLDDTAMANMIDLQVQMQTDELPLVRHDGGKVAIAGSSLGGVMAMEMTMHHPELYSGAASLSGAFWARTDLPGTTKRDLAVYLDSGGSTTDNSDSANDTIAIRDALIGLGWQQGCAEGPSSVCYEISPGATHDELAWKSRAWQFLEYLFPGT